MTNAAIAGRAPAIGPGLVVAVCFVIAVLEGYDSQAMGVAMPTMAPLLHLSKTDGTLAATAASLGLVLGAMFGGWFADRVGRKPVLLGSVILFGFFSLLTTLAFDGHTLILARLGTGLGFGGAMPNLIAIATEISKPERRALTTTTIFVGLPAGGGAVSLVTFFFAHGVDWRVIFLVGGAAPLLVAPLAMMLLPETRPTPHAGHVDRRSLAALFGGGRAVTTLCIWASFALTLTVIYLMLNWLPTLARAKGLSAQNATLAAFSFDVVGVAGGLVGGLLADRFSFRWPLVATYVGLLCSMVLLVAASGFWTLIALAGLAGFFVAFANYVLYAMVPLYYAAPVRGTASGAAVAVGRIGAIVGPFAGGMLLAAGFSAAEVMQVMVPVVIAAGAPAVLLTVVGKPYKDQA